MFTTIRRIAAPAIGTLISVVISAQTPTFKAPPPHFSDPDRRAKLEPSSVPADRLAHGYRWEDGQWKNEPLLANGSFGSMGGMLTTLSDLGRYVGSLIVKWDDAVADRMAAQNLFLDRDKTHRRADLDDLHMKVGACTAGSGFDHVENALRGDWTMACERGKVRVAITLAPTMPPKVQFWSVNAIAPTDTGQRARTCPE